MEKKIDIKEQSRRITSAKTQLVRQLPFFGRLILNMPIRFADCGTACTDMESIIFDPRFVELMSDDELKFVLLHEVLHCALKHCIRGRTLDSALYNIAADIVVNSMALEAMSRPELNIAGDPVMHRAPDGEEGRCYTAEEVYRMLLRDPETADRHRKRRGIDDHAPWKELDDRRQQLDDLWKKRINEALQRCKGHGGLSGHTRRHIAGPGNSSQINWVEQLHDLIQKNRDDYSYLVPNKHNRGKLILPTYVRNVCGSSLERAHFFVDTSGSVPDEMLTEIFCEIKHAITQIEQMSGCLWFFDTEVSEPLEFEAVEDVEKAEPIGGGGTDFGIIFDAAHNFEKGEPPSVIIILTDGYARFPSEEAAKGVPVVWIITDSDINAPWGGCIHISTQ